MNNKCKLSRTTAVASIVYALVETGIWKKAKFGRWLLGPRTPASESSIRLLREKVASLKQKLVAFV